MEVWFQYRLSILLTLNSFIKEILPMKFLNIAIKLKNL